VLNALDVQSRRWDPQDGSAARAELGLAPGELVIGVVSRLFVYKGHLDLLEALASVDTVLPPYKLVIIGEDDPGGDPGSGSFTERIRSLAATLGLTDKIMLIGFKTDVPKYMGAFDIYAMPSWEEPFGMVFLEAMSMGKPVVAWDQAGPSEIVADGVTGFLVPPKDIEALGRALRTLATDELARKQFGEAGRERVLELFTSDRMCDDMLDVYDQVAARRG
jgi:glycosyltransferase involved in cell wall biosynthesis